MVSYLPWYDKENITFIDFLKALETSFLYLEEESEKVRRNLNLNTSVEMLDLYEKRLGIPNHENLSYGQRREQIQSIINLMHIQTTRPRVEKVVEAFTNSKYPVSIINTDEIDVLEIDIIANDLIINLNELWMVLNKVMPAHLMFGFNLRYPNRLTLKEKTDTYTNRLYPVSTYHQCGSIYRHQYVGKKINSNIKLPNGARNRSNRKVFVGERKAGAR